jgi:hypothetical protein
VPGGLDRAWVEAAGRAVNSVAGFEDLFSGNYRARGWYDDRNDRAFFPNTRISLGNGDLSYQVASHA